CFKKGDQNVCGRFFATKKGTKIFAAPFLSPKRRAKVKRSILLDFRGNIIGATKLALSFTVWSK
ncbi:MAG: hypothetical protein KDI02_27760, partial [Anaerolineae bacterium]|nr:hypothetical protein [Anaerolineae bacterium]